MDALSPSDPAEVVVCKFASQSGKTEVLNNFVGYAIDGDPAPALVVQPNVKPMGEAWSKDRLAPMLRDSPTLRGKVSNTSKLNSDNTILHKSFPGGHLTVAGANSPAGLASRPIRYLALDEIDRYQVTREGDPKKLARKRTLTYWNRKILMTSSPTFADVGIDAEYKGCQQQYEWQLRCSHCGEFQYPTLKHFIWDDRDPETVRYACGHCGGLHSRREEYQVKNSGEYVLVKNEGIYSKGFLFNQWASPFTTWVATVSEFLDAKDDREELQVVTNTVFCEVWEEPGESVNENELMDRREVYDTEVPGGLVLTAGCDIQTDRIEAEVVSWSPTEESWSIDHQIFPGDTGQRQVWEEFGSWLVGARYTHASGRELSIDGACIDSGYLTSTVYAFVQKIGHTRVWGTKGVQGQQRPLIEGRDDRARRIRKLKTHRYKPELIGVDDGKNMLYRRLALTEVGKPGYCHFPMERDLEYFEQLTAERCQRRKIRGFPIREWVKIRPRNEALDMRVLAHAALRLLDPDWRALAKRAQPKDEGAKHNPAAKAPPKQRPRSRGNFVNTW